MVPLGAVVRIADHRGRLAGVVQHAGRRVAGSEGNVSAQNALVSNPVGGGPQVVR
jgi:hypothetical protein